MLPFLLRQPGLIFQHDNARPHTTRVAINCLQAGPILPWSAWSPNHRAHLGRLQPSRNIEELLQQLKTIWKKILQDNIQYLYQSRLCQMTVCIKAKGGPTPYSLPPFVMANFGNKSLIVRKVF